MTIVFELIDLAQSLMARKGTSNASLQSKMELDTQKWFEIKVNCLLCNGTKVFILVTDRFQNCLDKS